MAGEKTFAKGEHLFKEGEKTTTLYLCRSGSVSLFIPRSKTNIEVVQLANNFVVGDAGLFGMATHPFSCVALKEVKAFEVDVATAKEQLENLPQLFKMILKSGGDRQKQFFMELKKYKIEKDSVPLPPEQVAKLFGTIFYIANSKGKVGEDGRVTVEWTQFRQYAQKVFMEPASRLEQGLKLLVKLKYAQMQMVKSEDDPKAPEELGFIHFYNLLAVEQFFEFFQHYFFKNGMTDLLRTDEKCFWMVEALLKVVETAEADRKGSIRVDYTETLEKIKAEFELNITNDNWSLLEQKGLYVKRQTQEKGGVMLSFDRNEFALTFQNWRFLREIEKWNEKGFVDPDEVMKRPKKGEATLACPECAAELQGKPKFCGECGAKITTAA